jgi:hypothetical protein
LFVDVGCSRRVVFDLWVCGCFFFWGTSLQQDDAFMCGRKIPEVVGQ